MRLRYTKYFFLFFLFSICLCRATTAQEKLCPNNPDSLYNRQEVLKKFQDSLDRSLLNYPYQLMVKDDKPVGFFIYDLTFPLNKTAYKNDYCINFLNGHVYHLSSDFFDYSKSFIAILLDGEVKIFRAINCGDSEGNLREVVNFVKENLAGSKNIQNTLMRLENYRRYGIWIEKNQPTPLDCKTFNTIPINTDNSYSRYKILHKMRETLNKYIPNSFKEYNSFYSVENERAIGFYVQDLTDLRNKQTNLLEHVDFKEGHVYQFGWIDAPYSITHFAVLKNGDIHFFEAIDCKPKTDGLDKLTSFIEENIKQGKERSELINRVKNYQKYRIAIEFENKTQPECP